MLKQIKEIGVDEEQVLYARILETGMYIGLATLLITFAVYVLGILPASIPFEELPNYWSMHVGEYVETVNAHHVRHEEPITGWAWLKALNHGDYLNYVGIALLSAVTIVCFLGIVPTLLRKRDYAYAVMSVMEAAILAFAASGVLHVGH